LDTKEILNTIDRDVPTSSISLLPDVSTRTFTVGFSGNDTHSGIKTCNLFVSEDDGEYDLCYQRVFDNPFTNISDSFVFTGRYGKTYKFYCWAIDGVGNIQSIPQTYQAKTRVMPKGIRIEGIKRATRLGGTMTFYCLDDEGTDTYLSGSWTVASDIGTLSIFGTMAVFYANKQGVGTITARFNEKTVNIPVVVGVSLPYSGRLTDNWGSATVRIEEQDLTFLAPETTTKSLLTNLKGNIGLGIIFNGYDILANQFSGTITKPVFVEINYKNEAVKGIKEGSLMLYLSSDNGNTWGPIQQYSLDTEKNIISGTFSHLSIIAPAGEEIPEVFQSDLKNLSVYPNPFVPNDNDPNNGSPDSKITFSGLTDNVKIRIFNLAGRLVREEELSNQASWQWDAKNQNGKEVASGIYIYVITNNKGEKATGKIAIVK
jgi:hypothetical protein